jgi:Cytidine and deoxycytidylate deaminase zinc-binding region
MNDIRSRPYMPIFQVPDWMKDGLKDTKHFPFKIFPVAITLRSMSKFQFMRLALRLVRRGYVATSPNPMVGAVLVKGGKIIGRGWHRRAGLPLPKSPVLLFASPGAAVQ